MVWKPFLYVLVTAAFVVGGGSASFANEDGKIKEVIRSFFDPSNKIAAKLSLSHRTAQAERLYSFISSGMKSNDLWGDRNYVFGYANLKNGTFLIFAWKNDLSARDISMDQLGGIYSDERLASVQDAKALNDWKVKRASVIGSFLEIKRGGMKFATVYPNGKTGHYVTGRSEFETLTVKNHPLVIRIVPAHLHDADTDDLFTAVEGLGTR